MSPSDKDRPDPLALSPRKRALLARLWSSTQSARTTVGRRPPEEPPRASSTQERLWFLDRLEPGTALYNLPGVARVDGPLDVELLRRCLEAIARRHEVLRSRFVDVDGRPAVHLDEEVSVPLAVVDLSSLSEAQRREAVEARALEDALAPFDLARGPLFRARALKLGDTDWVILVALHHVVADGWSIGVLANEIAAAYTALSRGEEAALTDLPIQYYDWVHWQRTRTAREDADADLAYWTRVLRGAPPAIELPGRLAAPAARSRRAMEVPFVVPQASVDALREIGARQGATPFVTLLAAFYVLLARQAGQTDLVIGTPVANREIPETQPLIGFFANTLALRCDLGDGPSFLDVVGRVRDRVLEAFARQSTPFESIVAALQPERALDRTPLFQILFTLRQGAMPVLELPGASLRVDEDVARVAKFDLTMRLVEVGGRVHGALEYDVDLFERETVARMVEHWLEILAAVAREPDAPIARASMLPAHERAALASFARGPLRAPSALPTIVAEIRAAIATSPDAIAVSFEDEQLSYSELGRRAGLLARRLRRLGAGPDVVVGVCLERSVELVVALLAVLEAGAAYLPLDPDYPDERLRFMVHDSAAPVVVTIERLAGWMPDGPIRVSLDRDPAVDAGDDAPITPLAGPKNLAYVIYTSGSTGRPKGVESVHEGLQNRLAWMQDRFRLGPDDRVLHKTPYGFDVSVWELFWPLVAGARLVVATPGGHRDAEYLARTIVEQRISIVHFVPSMLSSFLSEPAAAGCDSLRDVVCSGEALTPEQEARFFAVLPRVELHNLYGPTEASIDVTAFDCAPNPGRRCVPIGRPIDDVTAVVLDEEMNHAGIGVPGELWLGGVQLARGYAHRPELTASRFVPDPFASPIGGRLYRTGDRARVLSDGVIEYLGRLDHQIKLRGFRIELGEIESALAEHGSVSEAVVVLRDDGAPGPRLVAYVVPERAGQEGLEDELRAHLQSRLPAYMVPSVFVALGALPLSPNGKLDRKALPAPGPSGDAEEEHVAPRDATELALAGIFAEVLGRDRVSVDRSFFDLGGHSLLATQVVSRIRARLGADVPIRAVFEAPTVAGLSRLVREARPGLQAPIRRSDARGPAPLSFQQERLWFLQQLAPDNPAYNVPVAVRFHGRVDGDAVRAALLEVVRRHDVLRTTFVEIAGRPAATVSEEAAPEESRASLAELDPSDRAPALARDIAAQAARPFDLGRGPLVRARWIELAPDELVLLLTMHHSVTDAWSLGVMLREIAEEYRVRTRGLPSALPALPLQYADYARWQRGLVAGDGLADDLAYWREQLAGAPTVLDLPTDRPRPTVLSYRGASRPVRIPDRVCARLREVGRRLGATDFMVLLAAFHVLLARRSRQRDILVGTPIANRTRAEIEGLCGLFVNLVVIRARLRERGSFADVVALVREAALGAYAHQAVPFELLVEELGVPRDLGRMPLVQAMFVLENAPLPRLALDDVTLEPIDVPSVAAKFDLSLTLSDDGGGFSGFFEYSSDLFDAATIDSMAEELVAFLDSALAGPDRPALELDATPADDRRRVLLEWNDTAVEYPPPTSLHALIARRIARTPDAVAVACEGAQLSYAELGRRAALFSRRLRARGVRRGDVVAVLAERSVELVIGLLGILQAGAAYLPLDPEHPAPRLRMLLDDARPAALAAQSRFRPDVDVPIAWLDGDDDEAPADAAVELGAGPRDGAYVIYTSGSTGRPKGVVVPHEGIENRLRWMQDAYGLGADDSVLQKTPYTFDVSVWELFWPLLTGARLVMARPGGHRDPSYLAHVVTAEQITTMHFVPSMLRGFLAEPSVGALPSLRTVVCSGEALDAELAAQALARFSARLHNLYGPTEASIDVTAWECERDVRGPVPIGRPIANTRTYVLDPALYALPPGVPGELFLGGVQLAHGYAARPDLTAERFVPDPHATRPGERLYRTGDLARWRRDGAIEFLGRLDHQVKIRGHRVELGEIEAALRDLDGVDDAAVVVRGAHADRALVAYVVGAAAARPQDLRDRLRAVLPEHLVPSAFVALETMPLTTSGKLDRNALPEPVLPAAATDYEAPRDELERVLAGAFESVLGIERVGIDDNFFDLGGDSIRSIQVRAKALERGVDISVQDLFSRQTVRELAQAARARAVPGPSAPRLAPFALVSARDRAMLPDGVEDAYPLSKVQAALVFESEFSPDYSIYVESVHVRAPLEVGRLHAAADEMIRRHPMLRTSFHVNGFGAPLQIVHRTAPVPLAVEDLRDMSPDAQGAWMDDWLRRQEKARFDWTSPPLFRLHVHRRTDDSFQLTLSHAFLDGWSMASFVAELGALALDPSHAQAPADVGYADFVALEQDALASADTRRFWLEQLDAEVDAGLPALAPHVPDRTTEAVRRVNVALPEEVEERLRRLARACRVPLKSVCLAVHARSLSLLAGRPRVRTGMLFNGRPERAGGDRVLGMFLNMLPVQLEVPGGTWDELVQAVFETERELFPLRRFPYAEIRRMHGRARLFDTLFNFTSFHAYEPLLRAAPIELLEIRGNDQDYVPLIVHFDVEAATKRLRLDLDYRVADLCEANVARIAEHYGEVLRSIARGGRTSYHCPAPIPERDRVRAAEWNRTDAPYPSAPVHRRVAEQAARTPDAVAVSCGGASLTYAELVRRARALARRLVSRGAGPGRLVAVAVERSLELPIALLAVLESGAAYVPLDVHYPADRLAFMLADCGATVLLTEQRLRAALPACGAEVVCVDEDGDAHAAGELALDAWCDPGSLAYVIYTSGSTGRPKGVQVTHRSLGSFLESMARAPGMGGDDVLVAVTSFSFDIAGLELWLPLVLGARVELAPRAVAGDGERLAELLRATGATIMQATPSTWRLVVDAGWSGATKVLVGGEALPPALATRLLERSPAVWNMYGPTETTIWSSIDRVGPQGVTLGHPIANTEVLVLDAHLEPVPIGVPGELYIGGDGLARGYLGRADVTAERFVPAPEGRTGARLYRTGDRVRRLEDGRIEFLGRVDHQVKVRGYRIELGEIEAVLTQHAAVREAVVTVVREDTGDALAAYWTSRTGAPQPTALELREHLKARLPEHMVPAWFVLLDALPLTPNGKIDRKALPAPDGASRAARTYVAPRTPDEQAIADVFAEVLGAPRVGADDDFFELGGHSLLATQVAARLRQALGRELTLRDLFDAPTPSALASRAGTGDPGPSLPPIQRGGEPVLSFGQERLWLTDQLDPGNPVYNERGVLELRGRLDVDALERSLRAVVDRHEVLRTSFEAEDGRPRAMVHREMHVQLELHEVSGSTPERRAEVERLCLEQMREPFDLARPPLLRARLVRVGPEEHVLSVTLHHIVSDAWTIGVLVREIAALYAAFASGRADPLPPLPIQYTDYARWQRELIAGPVGQAQVAYWRRTLAGVPHRLELPADRPRPPVPSGAGGVVRRVVPKAALSALLELSRAENVTPFMALFAVFATLLHRLSREERFVVGAPVANRRKVELEQLVGFFVNSIPLACDFSGAPTFRAVLARVRDMALEAYANQDVPFERLVQELGVARDASRAPLFQVVFAYQNTPAVTLAAEGLTVRQLVIENGMAKLDLEVQLFDTEEGLMMGWIYSTDLFDATRVEQMADRFELLAAALAARADEPVGELGMQTEAERAADVARRTKKLDALRKRVGERSAAPRATERQELVRRGALPGLEHGPLVLTPGVRDVDLAAWLDANRAVLDDALLREGAVLFRGFSVRSPADFGRVAEAGGGALLEYRYRSTPRTQVEGRVYSSTEYPPEHAIPHHNENAYARVWPMRLWFGCIVAAPEGGETPIARSDRVHDRIPSDVRAEFAAKGVTYVRNYRTGLDLPWQTVFQSTDRAEVERFCRDAGIEWEWRGDDWLQTRQTCQGVARHPRTGQALWFNQAHLFHVAALEPSVREAMLSVLSADELPRNAQFGDGSPIPDDTIRTIQAAYDAEEIVFRWEVGDVLLLDNMRFAHGRRPYRGPRQIVVAMAEPGSEVAR